MLLKDIPFAETTDYKTNPDLESRLKKIRNLIYGSNKTKEYTSGRYVRHVIDAQNIGWINEIQIEAEQKNNENFLVIKMFAGDTKQQSKIFFQKNPSMSENENRRYYVYLLINPFNKEIFYVRKGTGGRILSHEKEALNGGTSDKCQRIRSIWSKNRGIVRCKIKENLTSGEAEYIEARAIRIVGLDKLTNSKTGTEYLVSVPSVDEDGKQVTLQKPLFDLSESDLKVLINKHEERAHYHHEKARYYSDFLEIENKFKDK